MNSLIIQSDFTMILPVTEVSFKDTRDNLLKFSEIKMTSDAFYIFEITSLSIWNAIACGTPKSFILQTLEKYSTGTPSKLLTKIDAWFERYGVIKFESFSEEQILVSCEKENVKEEIRKIKKLEKFILSENANGFLVNKEHRGAIKSILIQHDLPVNDTLGFTKGGILNFKILDCILGTNKKIEIREYQEGSANASYISGNSTVTIPCGGGKTIIGVRLMELCQTTTLIVTNSQASVKQWKKTFLAFTTLREDDVSMYDKDNKVIKPVTITTYNMLAYKTKGEFLHFKKFASYNWGLVIMDEVHLMPADFFRIVTSLQSCKRLALTATFIREDGREKDIFSLVGPRRYNVSWKDLESKGYIAKVGLTEVRVPLNNIDKERYVNAKSAQEKFEIASTASSKLNVIKQLLEKHKNDKVLIIGMFTGHLLELAKDLNIPCVYGESSNKEREKYYDMMREDKINVLIASKIASTALDIPKINVVIQVSIQYGSRSAEAQIVGRATRPKESDAFFYTIVSKDTNEEDYNFNRKQFLMDEGYRYEVTEIAA